MKVLKSFLDNITLNESHDSTHLQLECLFKNNPVAQNALRIQYYKGLNEYGVLLNQNSTVKNHNTGNPEQVSSQNLPHEILLELIDALNYAVLLYKIKPSAKNLLIINHMIESIDLISQGF